MTVFCVDIDGTLTCGPGFTTFSDEEMLAQSPHYDMIEKVNLLYDGGHTVILHTSRLWSDFSVTTAWLEKYGVKYHTLIMAKPLAHYYIDDKNMLIDEFLKSEHEIDKTFISPKAMIEDQV